MSIVWDGSVNLYKEYLDFFSNIGINNFDYSILNRFDQIHAGGIKATEKLAGKSGLASKVMILELGGGIGGVARYLSAKFDANVINLDLSWSYSLTGKKLTELAGHTPIFFVNANALQIPFKKSSFEVIWLQHVNMNIADKDLLFSEIRRVIKPNGSLLFHEWFLDDSSKVNTEFKNSEFAQSPVPSPQSLSYPLPWSDDSAYNHLMIFADFIQLAEQHGFKPDFYEDESEISLKFYQKLIETKAFNNPIFRGRNPQAIFENTVSLLEKGVLKVYSGKLIYSNE
jgi:ubiquinone/menaquinone biosynthesis C-methylase UbiE